MREANTQTCTHTSVSTERHEQTETLDAKEVTAGMLSRVQERERERERQETQMSLGSDGKKDVM